MERFGHFHSSQPWVGLLEAGTIRALSALPTLAHPLLSALTSNSLFPYPPKSPVLLRLS